MSELDLQIFTREGATGRERESNQEWVEHPKRQTGIYNIDFPLWQPEGGDKNDGVYLYFPEANTVAFISRGKGGAEVFLEGNPIIQRGHPYSPINYPSITITPADAYHKLLRGEVIITEANHKLEFSIVVGNQVVKEVKIVGTASE